MTKYISTSTVYLVVTQTKGETAGQGQGLAVESCPSWVGQSRHADRGPLSRDCGGLGRAHAGQKQEPVERPRPTVGACLVPSSWRRDTGVAGVRDRVRGNEVGR